MNIFITGISKGLGLEMTRRFLNDGHSVMGISRTMTPELKQLLDAHPEQLTWHSCDLSETNKIEERLRNQFPLDAVPIHAFIDNAAMLYKNLIHRLDAIEVAKMVAVNAIAPMIVTKVMLNNFLKFKTQGSIVHLSSICAHRAFNGLSVMGATKAAIESFSKDIASEYGRFGIRSNVIVAGLLEIGMKSTVNEKLTEDLKSISSLRKLVDTPSIIDMVAYLISSKAQCITGENIHIDAGIV
jgi:3-oxoacyl-[acyl-carrier protein] reductase